MANLAPIETNRRSGADSGPACHVKAKITASKTRGAAELYELSE